MARPGSARGTRGRVLSLIPIVLVLVAAGMFVYASRTPDSPFSPKLTSISIQEAVAAYRANPRPLREDIPGPSRLPVASDPRLAGFTPPAPGVYTYRTEGSDWVEYNGQKYVRHFPSLSAATVRRSSGCVWELYFQAAKEYSDGHRQCSAPGQFLCLAHIQEVTFGSVHREMTHRCNPAMVQVGGKAVAPGGQQETVCYASAQDASKIIIRFKGRENVTVGGQQVPAYHVELISYVDGEMTGSALADVWFETRTGLYLKMVRTQDTSAKLPDGSSAAYRVRVTYQLESLTPQV